MNLLLIVVFGTIAEVLVWIGVGDLVGSMWYVFFWFIIAFFIGLNLVRSSTSNIMPQLQQMQMTGQLGGDPAVTKKLAIAMSGFLLMLPGLISDVLAVLVLIPAVQTAFRNALMKTMAKRQQAMMDQMMGGMGGGAAGGQNPFADLMRQMQDMQNQQGGGQYRDSTVIDGEAREVKPEQKKIEFKDVN
ncbi:MULTISPECIES: FxsA family protein [Acinetobacter]|uniref:FxsA family protein n=2 Tax=Acinetobacter TaxID=469 RepID=A0ABT7WKZ9_9GAMM|nr:MULTISPECIES: FxsA family protein [Acinetobacter]MCY6411254.1 FxsA family protein [Acinetobacter thutiue]MDH0031395.1 FxsA family protein [Acinetobacter sp. GD04021]MDH0887120.1 FxsA family protein [Acinetobacter sp. GD03873]MDH1083591.1 FxsA family protein [Acinetobacter sp. GD03983]MDH2190436.1 FxsA family protein [Acinetobacter sp. GD03645]